MINPCNIRNLIIGNGIAKICVPIVDTSEKDIIESAKNIKKRKPDMVEFRADFYEYISDTDKTIKVLENLKNEISDIPLLFTFRTKEQGGAFHFLDYDYIELNLSVAKSKLVDAIDIECVVGEHPRKNIIAEIKKNNVKVIGSYHNNSKTPNEKKLKQIIETMLYFDADILKIAVTPQNKKDVFDLMYFSQNMNEKLDRPLIAISMGELGMLSRISCDMIGSSITFASAGKSSASGQLDISELQSILSILRK